MTGNGEPVAGAGGLSQFADKVQQLILGPDDNRLVFTAACTILGFLVVTADALYRAVTKRPSLLKLGANHWALVWCVWPLGAGLVGLLSHAIGLIQPTIQASVAVAAAWTVYLPRVIAEAEDGGEEEEQEEVEDAP